MKAAIIGGGNIGMALAEGLIRARVCKPGDITITRRNISSLKLCEQKGFAVSTDNVKAIGGADTVFICVLPQQLDEVLKQLQPAVDLKKQLLVSVVTGAHTQVFRERLGSG